MILKLVMPFIDRSIQGGIIMKWYKREGEWVEYGDDLLEVKIAEFQALDRTQDLRFLSELSREGSKARAAIHAATELRQHKADGRVCIVSSDVGIIRKIYAEEGVCKNVGDSLALLTTDHDEPIEESDWTQAQVTLFRTVANIIT